MTSSRTLTAFFWSFLEQGGSKLVALVVQIVLARLLAPEAFGVLAILLVVTNVADAIAQSGLGAALVQSPEADDRSYTTAFWLSMAVAVALFLAIQLAAPLIASFYAMEGLEVYLRVLAVVVFLNSANSIQRSYLQKRMDFKSLFYTTFAAQVVSGVLGIAAALAGAGIWALVVQSITLSTVTCLVMAIRVPWKPRLQFDAAEARSLFSFGWKVAATSILNVLYSGVSELVLGKVCTSADLGLYSQGRKYPMSAINVVNGAVQNVMFPALAQKADDPAAFKYAARRALVTGSYVIAPCTLLLAAIADPLVDLLLTSAWAGCVPIFQMTCTAHAVMMTTAVNLRAYMALGRSDLYLSLQVVKVLIGGVCVCATAVITGDIYLTASAMLISTLFNTLMVDALPAGRVYGYSAFAQIRDMLPTLTLSIVAAGAAYALTALIRSSLAALLASISAFAIVYLGLSRLFKLRGFDDCLAIARTLAGKGNSKQ